MNKKTALIYLIRRHLRDGVFRKNLIEQLAMDSSNEDFQSAVFSVLWEI